MNTVKTLSTTIKITITAILTFFMTIQPIMALSPQSSSTPNVVGQTLEAIESGLQRAFGDEFAQFIRMPKLTAGVNNNEKKNTYHEAMLDFTQDKGGVIAQVPKGTVKNKHNILALPLSIPKELIPESLQEELGGETTPKKVGQIVSQFLAKSGFTNTPIEVLEEQQPTSKLTSITAAYDPKSSIAVVNQDGSISILAIFMIPDEDTSSFKSWSQKFVEKRETEKFNFDVPQVIKSLQQKEYGHNKAKDWLAKNAWKLWFSLKEAAEAGETDSTITKSANEQIRHLISQIDLNEMLDFSKLQWDEEGQILIYKGEIDNPFTENLKQLKIDMNAISQLATLLYRIATPTTENGVGKLGVDPATYESIIKFYYQVSQFFEDGAKQVSVGDSLNQSPALFEPMREFVGRYTNRLVNAYQKTLHPSDQPYELDLIDINTGDLSSLQRLVSGDEYDNLVKLQNTFKDQEGWAWDLLMLQRVLSPESFIRVLPKVKASKKIRASDKGNQAVFGTGRIATAAIALRLGSDLNDKLAGGKDKDYTGRYILTTRSISGKDEASKLKAARDKVANMFLDASVEAASIDIVTPAGVTKLHQLLQDDQKGIEFEISPSALDAIQDSSSMNRSQSVYPVRVNYRGSLVAKVYLLDSGQYAADMQELDEKKAQGKMEGQFNYPMPLIVEDSKIVVNVDMIVDATPGGIHMGGNAELDTDSPDIATSLAEREIDTGTTIQDTLTEHQRYKEIRKQLLNRIKKKDSKAISYLKAQVFKHYTPDGGSHHYIGDSNSWWIPMVGDVSLLSPCSCSTNGASAFVMETSTLMGFGTLPWDLIGQTDHMYTGGDKKKGDGSLNAKSTGAAVGVAYGFPFLNTIFTAVRTPTKLKDGEIEIVGGSAFFFNMRLPYDIPSDVLKAWFDRIAEEDSSTILTFEGKEQNWKKTIFGQKTGSIVYTDHLQREKNDGSYSAIVGYDNEISFSARMAQLTDISYKLSARQNDVRTIEAVIGEIERPSNIVAAAA